MLLENNIELTGTEELWSIYHWFDEKIEHSHSHLDFQQSKEQLYQEMKQRGLDLCFKIPSKTPIQ
ncbi:hypothetical protein BKI52_41340 [marine bacterium AO1-C]|nr:hypothetical protein BKI52_41340 [marine bacterium AO1-C]